jgi:hypothetical protein
LALWFTGSRLFGTEPFNCPVRNYFPGLRSLQEVIEGSPIKRQRNTSDSGHSLETNLVGGYK